MTSDMSNRNWARAAGAAVWGLLLLVLAAGCGQQGDVAVIYAAQDQVYAEPILREFTKQTGIRVKPVFDSEAVKTVGLAQRLLQERAHPQCDVFWGNEEMRARQLAAQEVFRETNGWEAFGYRSRRIVINTNHLALAKAPQSIMELTNEVWRGKVALAYPLFGTTATHFLVLRQVMGQTNWLGWCRALRANKPFLVDGNSVVVQLVGRGEAWIGLTDSDDIAAGQEDKQPVASLPLDSRMLLIPNTVGVVRNAPHADAAQKLFLYLQSPGVLEKLVAAKALEGAALPSNGLDPKSLDWTRILSDLPAATTNLSQIFLR
jgi:iron(III) transport system substrate-binding protein